MSKLIGLCPDHEDHEDHPVRWKIKLGVYGEQCCTRNRCLVQAKELADAIWVSTLEVLVAQILKHGRIRNSGGWTGNLIAANNASDIGDGNGLKCMAWQEHLSKPISTILSKYAAEKSLCFRACGVSTGIEYVNFHAWWQIYKGDNFPMTTRNHSISLDPWPSGGRSLIDDSHNASRLIDVYSYYE